MSLYYFPNIHVVKDLARKNQEEVPLAYLVPLEKKEKADRLKQIQNAKNWAKEPEEVRFENEPKTGFKISKMVRRGCYGHFTTNNVVWRVTDPRGFEIEIPSGNLYEIIVTCGISTGGEITESCYYGRQDGKNIIIPSNSDLAKKAEDISSVKKQAEVFLAKDKIKRFDFISYHTRELTRYSIPHRPYSEQPKLLYHSFSFYGGKLKLTYLNGYIETLYGVFSGHFYTDLEEKNIVQTYIASGYDYALKDYKVWKEEKLVEITDLVLYKTFRVKKTVKCPYSLDFNTILDLQTFCGTSHPDSHLTLVSAWSETLPRTVTQKYRLCGSEEIFDTKEDFYKTIFYNPRQEANMRYAANFSLQSEKVVKLEFV